MPVSHLKIQGAFVFSVLILAGCIEAELPGTEERPVESGDRFRLDWSPPDGVKETVFMVNVTTGPDTSCKVSQWSRFRFGSETAIASISYGHGSDGGSRFSGAVRGGETAHAGPVNTDSVGAETWGGLLYEGTARIGGRPGNGTSYEGIMGVFDLRPNDDDPANLSVECTSNDVHVRLYLADSYQPVIDKSAKGGAGVYTGSTLDPIPTLTVNHDDRFDINTKGDEVRFFARLTERDDAGMEPSLDGELHINTPSNNEKVLLEHVQDEFVFTRSWIDPGDYVLGLDQFSVEGNNFMGLLAGFALEEEWESLEDIDL